MNNNYILLHRKFFDSPDRKNNHARCLAWLEFVSMAAWADYTAHDGVHIKRGEVIASYGFLAKRWGKSKSRVHAWIELWIAERQVERRTERCAERGAERFFIVNYATYQDGAERGAERPSERRTERPSEPIKRKFNKKSIKENIDTSSVSHILFDHYERLSGRKVRVRTAMLSKINARMKEFTEDEIVRAWENMSTDDFLRGKSDRNESGKDYFTIEYALRSNKIDQYLAKGPSQIAQERAEVPHEPKEWDETITRPDGTQLVKKVSI